LTRVFFYHNAADRIAAAASLIGKALAQKKALLVYAPDAEVAAALDRHLWTHPPTGFVPHVAVNSPLAAETPVLIADRLDVIPNTMNDCSTSPAEVPQGFARFNSLIEIVGQGDEERLAGRRRARLLQGSRLRPSVFRSVAEGLMADDSDLIRRANSLINAEAAAGWRSPGRPAAHWRRRSFIASTTPPRRLPELRRRPRQARMRTTCRCSPRWSCLSPFPRTRRSASTPACAQASPQTSRTVSIGTCKRIAGAARVRPAPGDGTGARESPPPLKRRLRDFLAQRGQLRLPLPDPDSDQAGGA
jgi:DNA polymerase-3 subunit chi